jgi:phage terminase large subunit
LAVLDLPVIPAAGILFRKARYKVLYGGRGSGKSWSAARILVAVKALEKRRRILCTREFQKSIADSVHKLLSEQIYALGLADKYSITQTSIRCVNGSEFIFTGLHNNVNEIKSMEGLDIVWLEEAQSVSDQSWDVLIPTVRNQDSEIWITFNPDERTDPTYKRFVLFPPPGTLAEKVNHDGNPWFSDSALVDEMEHCKANYPEKYLHIWEGDPKALSESTIFKTWDTQPVPEGVKSIGYGLDFGYGQDPASLIGVYERNDEIWLDEIIYQHGLTNQDLGILIKDAGIKRTDEIIADSAEPKSIEELYRQGFNVHPAVKGPDSVNAGINKMLEYKIHITPRSKNVAKELTSYSWSKDKDGNILPKPVDMFNHAIDAVRYRLMTRQKQLKASSLKGLGI